MHPFGCIFALNIPSIHYRFNATEGNVAEPRRHTPHKGLDCPSNISKAIAQPTLTTATVNLKIHTNAIILLSAWGSPAAVPLASDGGQNNASVAYKLTSKPFISKTPSSQRTAISCSHSAPSKTRWRAAEPASSVVCSTRVHSPPSTLYEILCLSVVPPSYIRKTRLPLTLNFIGSPAPSQCQYFLYESQKRSSSSLKLKLRRQLQRTDFDLSSLTRNT